MVENNKNLVQQAIFPQIVDHLDAKEITLIIGPRQVGKTTLLSQLASSLSQKGVPESRILSFNLDLVTDRTLFASQTEFIKFLKERIGGEKLFVFVDEAQRVENAGIFFKGIYDLNLPVKFVLTGSSALEIKSKIHEPLTGRKRVFYLYPLSFREYLSSKDGSLVELFKTEHEVHIIQENGFLSIFSTLLFGADIQRLRLRRILAQRSNFSKRFTQAILNETLLDFLRSKIQPLLRVSFRS